MRRFVSLAATSLLLVTSISASASETKPKSEPPPKKELQVVYSTYDKAVKAGMPGMQKWCEENLAPDFTIVFLDGNKLDRKQYLEMLDRLVKNPAPSWKDVKSQKTRITKLALQSGEAVATVDIETVYDTKDPKHRQIALERPYKETWTKVSDVWKVKKTEEMEPKVVAAPKPGQDKGRRPSSSFPRGGGMPRNPFPNGGGRYGYPGG